MLLHLLRTLLQSLDDAVVPLELVCPISGKAIRQPAEWRGGNILDAGGDEFIMSGCVYDYEALLYAVTITLGRLDDARRISTTTPACREMSRKIGEWRASHGVLDVRTPPQAEPGTPVGDSDDGEEIRVFESDPPAIQLVRTRIISMLGFRRALTPDDERLVQWVFRGTVVDDSWTPSQAMMNELLINIVWASSPVLRLRVYGEFAQLFHQGIAYAALKPLGDERKSTGKSLFLLEAHENPAYAPLHAFVWRVVLRFAGAGGLTPGFRDDFNIRWHGDDLLTYVNY